jgi:cyanophycin synthetase
LAAPGDRRDEDIWEIGRIAAGGFDRLIVRRDDDLRGRKPTEVPDLLRRSAIEAGMAEDFIDVIPDEERALDHALKMGQRGDLLIVFGDKISRCWKQITKFHGEHGGGDRAQVNVGALASNTNPSAASAPALDFDGQVHTVIADDRGVRLKKTEPETED